MVQTTTTTTTKKRPRPLDLDFILEPFAQYEDSLRAAPRPRTLATPPPVVHRAAVLPAHHHTRSSSSKPAVTVVSPVTRTAAVAKTSATAAPRPNKQTRRVCFAPDVVVEPSRPRSRPADAARQQAAAIDALLRATELVATREYASARVRRQAATRPAPLLAAAF
eukprot:CAMPEP_0185709760 /NCGR_PEP_ID=MMETSP1164-20130828/29354_1 /TAXON_ID=1104430 /ORGANISM="Chrysoreinhardia sp, Strain CCMP2950" /LENGTH=164 /DNA_ID=CAMNT_0028377257 /DNA_START=90 /DNA_END=584 /DNA_ORIENTATION=-